MDTGAAIVAIAATLCGLAFLILLGLLFTSLVIRTAVSIFNRLAGSPKTPALVPLPSLAKGMLIGFTASVLNVAIYATSAFATGALSTDREPNPQMSFTAWLISSPLSLLVLACLLTGLLPTTFPRALLITLCYVLLAILLTAAIALHIAAIAAAINAEAISSN